MGAIGEGVGPVALGCALTVGAAVAAGCAVLEAVAVG
jgi:hypothetical protein